jgi:hypothetical protein
MKANYFVPNTRNQQCSLWELILAPGVLSVLVFFNTMLRCRISQEPLFSHYSIGLSMSTHLSLDKDSPSLALPRPSVACLRYLFWADYTINFSAYEFPIGTTAAGSGGLGMGSYDEDIHFLAHSHARSDTSPRSNQGHK